MSNAKKNNNSSSKALRAKLQQGLTQRLGKKGQENLEKQSELDSSSINNPDNHHTEIKDSQPIVKIVTALPGINFLADSAELHPNHNKERSKEREEQFMKTLQQASSNEENITKKIFHPDNGDYIEKGLEIEPQLSNEDDHLSILPPPPLSAPDFFNNKNDNINSITNSSNYKNSDNTNKFDDYETDETQYTIDTSVVDIELDVPVEYLLKIKNLQEKKSEFDFNNPNELQNTDDLHNKVASEEKENLIEQNISEQDNALLDISQEPSIYENDQIESPEQITEFTENSTNKSIQKQKNNGSTMDNTQSDKKNKKSTLKSPAHNVAQPQQTDPRAHLHISEEEKNKRKDVVSLRSPLERGVAKPAQDPKDITTVNSNDTETNGAAAKSYEQEIIRAIKNGNLQWLEEEATLENKTLSPQRQEIIFMVAVEYIDALEILLKKGFSFTPKGIAVNSALKNNNFPALNILSQFGAQLDPQTLIALAKWQREQNLEKFSHSTSANTENDYNTNLNENATEEESATSPSEPDLLENELNNFINEISQNSNENEEIQNSAQDDLHDTTPHYNEDIVSNEVSNESEPQSNSNPNLHSHIDREEEIQVINDSKPTNSEFTSNKEKQIMATPTPTPQRYVPKTFNSSTTQSGSGLTALERAKLKNYEQILLEKQALESKLLELSAYEDAAQSMEQELISANNEIERLQEIENEQNQKIDILNKKISDLSKVSTILEENKEQIKQLQNSNQNLANLLAEKEQVINAKNDEIEKLQTQIEYLEEKPDELPEATDILVDSGLDEQLRNDTFIELVLSADLQAIENLATNAQISHKQASYALAYTAQTGNIEIAQWLIDNLNADIHCANELPLFRAIENDNYEMIMFLIEKGANIHHADSFALRKAVQKNDTYLMNLLIKKGANIHVQDNRVLKEALEFKSWECFQALLAYGATFVDDDGEIEEIFEQNEEAQSLISWFQEQQSMLSEMDPVFLKLYLSQKQL